VKPEYETLRTRKRFSDLREELGCPSTGVMVCGRLVTEKQRYAQIEEELERTKLEREEYRVGFDTLLGLLNSSLRKDLVIETFRQKISKIPEVKSAYCLRRKNILSFSVFMESENWEAEDKVFDVYGDLLDAFEELDIRVRVLRLYGRNDDEVLPDGGFKLIG
jgi:hypothetical protein